MKLTVKIGQKRSLGQMEGQQHYTNTEEEIIRQIEVINKFMESNFPEGNYIVARKVLHQLTELCKGELNVDFVVAKGGVNAVVPLLQLPRQLEQQMLEPTNPTCSLAEEILKEACFILGRLAIKPDYQVRIADAGAIPFLVALLKEQPLGFATPSQPGSGGVARRACDAITNMAHENIKIKSLVKEQGGIPPLVNLLESLDVKVQRAAAGALRTLAFKNEENKQRIVECGALPTLIQMLWSDDPCTHYEAVGVIGNLVHSSSDIKRQVLEAGALQPVIHLLSSSCTDSQREAALLIGQFATTTLVEAAPDQPINPALPHPLNPPHHPMVNPPGFPAPPPPPANAANNHILNYKAKIVQRGALPPLIRLLSQADDQLKEMAAFAVGRLGQDRDNAAGIVMCGGLPPLLELLSSTSQNQQHNAAFALYGLADTEDNIPYMVKEGTITKLQNADKEFKIQQSKDCANKTLTRLEGKVSQRVLKHTLYLITSSTSQAEKERTAVGLAHLVSKSHLVQKQDLQKSFMDKEALDVLLTMITENCKEAGGENRQRLAAEALVALLEKVQSKDVFDCTPEEPSRTVYLGRKYVNNSKLSDVTFLVENQPFYAHRIALSAASECFNAMFVGNYRENECKEIPIPDCSWEVFEAIMVYIYTGTVEVPQKIAQELLRASDYYILDGLKRLCENTLMEEITPETVADIYSLAERCRANQLAQKCVQMALQDYRAVVTQLGGVEMYAQLFERMVPVFKEYLRKAVTAEEATGMDCEDGETNYDHQENAYMAQQDIS
eukprot:TRINITY_DN2991_c1_g3_i1.p1 TRINITY_DN2991_c1_g3~~TRINITY_DN2991_c1_g3_i1.p1  ORF type:complete len:783 (-),score=114.99 TRINITY_DN2991_c1_g3_i1:1875-4223(-)